MEHLKPAAVLFTANLPELALFYEEVAGLAARSGDSDHTILENGIFRLIVHRIPDRYRLSHEAPIASPPVPRESAAIKLSFPVESLAKAREAAARRAGCVFGPEREWRSESAILVDGLDPDGNVFQVFQSLDSL